MSKTLVDFLMNLCRRPVIFLSVVLAIVGTLPSLRAQDANLFAQLASEGLVLTDDVAVKLPLASLREDLSGAQRAKVLEELAGRQGWSRFARDSVTAPVAIDIESIRDAAGKRLGLEVHAAFVIYASLDKLRDKELMEQIFGPPGKSDDAGGIVTEEIAVEELQRLGIPAERESNEAYWYVELPLLNRILIRGVIHIESRERTGAYEIAWQLDPQFQSIERYVGRWTKLDRNAVGRLEEGESKPYTGLGGFLGVYEIDKAAQQLLVESRMILHEPDEWFAGSNFLRSKLPLSMQENARSLRRRLAQ